MKKLVMSLFITGSVIFFSCEDKKTEGGEEKTTSTQEAEDTAATPRTFVLDTAKSIIKWTGKKVTGSHNGKIRINSGEIKTAGKVINGGSIVINMNSITNEDLTETEANQKLLGHLRSDDFFGVEKFPTATFAVTRIDAGKSEDEGIITGNLTIKGKTVPISIPATIKFDDNKLTAKGNTVIDRTKWDIRYGSGKFFENLGDKAIYDEVDLEFDVEAYE